jgi:F-type H+-transporting ATPase subunit gamma
MAQELKETKRRITSIRHIRKVTTALQKVAVARTAKIRSAIENTELYSHELVRLLAQTAPHLSDTNHPLLTPKPGNTAAVIIFGSEKGLCGNFNSAMAAKLSEFRAANPDKNLRTIVVGKSTFRYVKRLGIPVDNYFDQPQQNHLTGQASTTEAVTALARNRFIDGTYSRVLVLFTRFVTMLRQLPTIDQILPARLPDSRPPLPSDAGISNDDSDCDLFEPEPGIIAARLLNEYFELIVHLSFLNSLGSENAARQAAMSRASENAGKMLDDLMVTYWRLRQESITSEITELARGSTV